MAIGKETIFQTLYNFFFLIDILYSFVLFDLYWALG